jgi:hypothetical protein
MEGLTREALDEMRCGGGHPDGSACDHSKLYLHGRCHMGSPTWAVYSDGTLTIICATCEKPIAVIAVAEGTAA